jgi:virginiamycin B lyase
MSSDDAILPAPVPQDASVPRRFRWGRWLGAGVLLAGIIAAVVWAGRIGPWASWGFTEYRMRTPTDIPAAIAVARDGTVWFTIEFSDAIGRLRDGEITRIRKGSENLEPLGLVVDRESCAWFTDSPRGTISRLCPGGESRNYRLDMPVVKFGRLAIGPDDALWFAEPIPVCVTQFKDGEFRRYVVGPPAPTGMDNVAPFGVAVDPRGVVWVTLQNANKLVRVTPDGATTAFSVPTRRSALTDVAVDANGAVWFLELSANKVGRFAEGRFREFPIPTPNAAPTALAVAPDGAIWFTELRGHKLGRLRDGVISEFALPRPDARPFGVAVDSQNNVWYTDLAGWVGRLASERAKRG